MGGREPDPLCPSCHRPIRWGEEISGWGPLGFDRFTADHVEHTACMRKRHQERARSHVRTHPEWLCTPDPCCVHNPSDHHMVSWPLVHRTDRPHQTGAGLVFTLSERTCPHGVGHPDPDSLAYARTLLSAASVTAVALHGCCPEYCCRPGSESRIHA